MLLWCAYIFVNSLDLEQAQHNVGSDLDPICLTLSVHEIFFEKVKFGEKKTVEDEKKIIKKLPNIYRKKNIVQKPRVVPAIEDGLPIKLPEGTMMIVLASHGE